MAGSPAAAEEVLPLRAKLGYALGDHTVNIQLAAVSLFFLFFLTEVAGLPPAWAGLVLWIGRAVDAFTDPAMGRFSDRTRWRLGRRRPFFLIGALPFGATFALLWATPDAASPAVLFAWFVAVYVANTLCSTVLAVPYMALLPEMALGYQERTSMNTWRMVAVLVAILATAVGMPWMVAAFGGGARGYATAGAVFGAWIALPWLVVYAVSWERPGFRRPATDGFVAGMKRLARHRSYRILAGLFLAARIAVDVVGALLLFYFTYWLGRPGDFPLAMAVMLGSAVLSLPAWLAVSRRIDKSTLFIAGVLWWIAVQAGIGWLEPDHPRALVFALLALAGIAYGMADPMPWSMLGDVIDEDELATGQRSEGVYAGFFTFVRKLGGASGVAVAGVVLQLAGFERGGAEQSDTAIAAIRWLTALAPALALAVAALIAFRYPLGRERHARMLEQLAARRNAPGG
ncbi:MAG: glycoside-pentoside-hexuronide (GPH):cation symporter [Myxococcota bacterium]|nr:glycoside-pentoside-hexuronide (GPH):cation symporter [Myxococcota bacterium]